MTQTGMTPRVAAMLRKAGAGEILDADAIARNPRPDTGSYLLVLFLERRLPVAWRTSEHVFEPGWYVYAGSARPWRHRSPLAPSLPAREEDPLARRSSDHVQAGHCRLRLPRRQRM
jgi:hypothetical protein